MSTTSSLQEMLQWCPKVLREIQLVFGEMKINQHEFTNCGVRHVQCPRTFAVTLDQIHFAATLQTISHPQVTNGQLADLADDTLHSLYRSLLGAVAYLAHTRVDIMVFVCALQRHVARPTVEHARKLNRVLRWIQKNPKKLHYVPFQDSATHLRVVSDAAFKKETADGYSLRGALFLRCEGSIQHHDHSTQTVQPCSSTTMLASITTARLQYQRSPQFDDGIHEHDSTHPFASFEWSSTLFLALPRTLGYGLSWWSCCPKPQRRIAKRCGLRGCSSLRE